MKNTHFISYTILLCILFSCKNKVKRQVNFHQIKVTEAKSYSVTKDSIAEPKILFVDENKLKKVPVDKPKIIPTNTNIHIASKSTITIAGKPKLCVPGLDTFTLPKTTIAHGKIVPCGLPEVVIVKDAYTKDQNSQSFSIFGKLQGLKHNYISCALQDKSGNIWFGTIGGGVSKYNGLTFTHYTEKEGLNSNTIFSILEDRKGNLWFGTNGSGVTKYDGEKFTHFTNKEGFNEDNSIYSMLEDINGNIWFGTESGGVSKFDGENFTHFTIKEGLVNNTVYSILEDKKGNIWFGTSAGVSKYNEKNFTNFTTKEGLNNNTVFSILEDKKGNLWFGTNGGGADKYDNNNFIHYSNKEGLSDNIRSMLEDKNGNIWFGSSEFGVYKFDGKNFTNFSDKEGLSSNDILSILQDNTGGIWFNTDLGISKYNGETFTHFTEKEGLINNVVYSILKDKKGNLWFGTQSGISIYNGKIFTNFSRKEGLPSNQIITMLEDKDGNIWLGVEYGVYLYDGKKTTKIPVINASVWSMLQDTHGNIWFGTDNGLVKYDKKQYTYYSTNQGLCDNRIWSIEEDRLGNIWLGTSNGLSKYDGITFSNFTTKGGLNNNIIWSILEDKVGNIWIGTDNGVSKYNGKTFTHFTEKDGLCNNVVFSILQDKKGNIWFGTRFGLSKLTPNKLNELTTKINLNTVNEDDVFFKNYTITDGFLGIGCWGNSICEADDGTIWFGANDRLTVYHPPIGKEKPDSIVPKIQLTNINLFNENISWKDLENKKDTIITLSNGVILSDIKFDSISKWYSLPTNLSIAYNNNYITFNFVGVSMNQPKQIKYQYKLEGIDENWGAITQRTEANYGNLPSGNYTFKVKAMNCEGYWCQPLEYSFIIRPPFWQTWWFRSLFVLLILGSIILYIKWREKKLKAEKEILEKTVIERTAEVTSQKSVIEEKHKEITDSINYAERIQRSFLATKELLDTNLKDYFVFFQPKDVVSGDFYWAISVKTSLAGSNNYFILATADSTGHGVPGAIMSLLNITSLESAIKDGFIAPADILNATRKTIIERLKKDGSINGGKDGMDVSLISLDFTNLTLTYAAANNPVWIVREKNMIELSADKMPVGKGERDNLPFTQHTINLQKGDVIYTLTDGMPDQFGGSKGKKFMYKQLKELLIDIAQLPMELQKEKITNTLNNWKGDLDQVDDVCLIGIRI